MPAVHGFNARSLTVGMHLPSTCCHQDRDGGEGGGALSAVESLKVLSRIRPRHAPAVAALRPFRNPLHFLALDKLRLLPFCPACKVGPDAARPSKRRESGFPRDGRWAPPGTGCATPGWPAHRWVAEGGQQAAVVRFSSMLR